MRQSHAISSWMRSQRCTVRMTLKEDVGCFHVRQGGAGVVCVHGAMTQHTSIVIVPVAGEEHAVDIGFVALNAQQNSVLHHAIMGINASQFRLLKCWRYQRSRSDPVRVIRCQIFNLMTILMTILKTILKMKTCGTRPRKASQNTRDA